MKMRTVGVWLVALMTLGVTVSASAQAYVEYYRSNLFLGLAYHRIGCLTDWTTIQSDQDYDGFTETRYCFAGDSSDELDDAEWFAWNYATGKAQLDACGEHTNTVYDTPNYAARSGSCNYNVLFDCNSDCWIREFSTCQGSAVPIISPCW